MSRDSYATYTFATMTSGLTISAEIDIQRSYQKVYLVVPTMVSSTDIYIQAAPNSGGTYRRVFHGVLNSSVVAGDVFVIGSAATQANIRINEGFRFYKIELSTAMTASSANFTLICTD